MYEEICLVCSRPLRDDGRAYCSGDCRDSDLASPSISSSSSALSSPQFGFANGGDVPTLAPSALGSALRQYQGRDPYYVTSSASSNSWSLVEDDEDDDAAFSRGKMFGSRDGDSIFDGSSKSANFIYSMMPSALSYARRPSGTNNHSTVPQVHQRSSSGSSPAPTSAHGRGVPRSAPNHSHSRSSTDEEGDLSDDYSPSFRDTGAADDNESEKEYPDSKPMSSKARRNRNRASLPAYFSLLQTNSPAKELKMSPMSSSSGNTVPRPSPPTPKHAELSVMTKFSAPSVSSTLIHETPRGRQRDAGESRCSRRSERSSPSRSRSRHVRNESPRPIHNARPSRINSKGSVEQVFDWATGFPRGRAAVRRNSSPPPRILMGIEDPTRVLAPRDTDRSQSKSTSGTRTRGRVPVDQLDGIGSLSLAPGYGNGRSGLLDRGRLGASGKRVPL